MRLIQMKFFACRTDVDIAPGIVLEELGAKELGAVVQIGKGNIGANALIFQGDNIVFGAVLAVTGSLPRPQLPAEAATEDQIQHRLIFHHFGWGHQDRQNDAIFAPIDD
jgi:hypothetical protein